MAAAAVELVGYKELLATFRREHAAVAKSGGDQVAATARKIVMDGNFAAARMVRDRTRSGMVSQNWPNRVVSAAFAFGGPQTSGNPARLGALMGVRTGARPHFDEKLFVEWHSRGQVRGDVKRLASWRRRMKKG